MFVGYSTRRTFISEKCVYTLCNAATNKRKTFLYRKFRASEVKSQYFRQPCGCSPKYLLDKTLGIYLNWLLLLPSDKKVFLL